MRRDALERRHGVVEGQPDLKTPYSRKFSWDKIFVNYFEVRFHRENFRELLKAQLTTATTLYFAKKIFTRGLRFAKFTKKFSYNTFPLYGIMLHTECLVYWINC